MSELFTLEHDYVSRVDIHFQGAPGTLVQTPDGRLWTVVYHNLDGYGVVEGDRPDFIGQDDDGLIPPTHMLRDSFNRISIAGERVEFLGKIVRVIRRVRPDGEVVSYPVNIDEPGF